MHTDLFPETLLVDVTDGHTFTTSLKIAEHFHKSHKNVIQNIQKLISDVTELEISRLNFQPSDSAESEISRLKSEPPDSANLGTSLLNFEESTYKNARGKTYPIYLMDRKSFSILAGRFTGKKALQWQIDFQNAFEAMEAQLAAHIQREAAALHALRPLLAPVVAATEQGQSRSAIGAQIDRSPNSVSYHRRTARRLGLLPQRKTA